MTARPYRWRYGDLEDKNFRLRGRALLVLLLLLLLLSATLIAGAIICVYIRRKRRRRHASPSSVTAASCGGGGEGLDEAALRRLPIRVRQADAAACPICLGVIGAGAKERVLPACSHAFHPACVDEWLQKRRSCPLCRANVEAEVK